jgi:DNA mismatch endonuclease (patch repair protein)
LHQKDLPGRPDIVLPRFHAAILVHGCFWHRHGCRLSAKPSSNAEFWEAKFASNVRRDALQREQLLAANWRLATIWECGIRDLGADRIASLLSGWLLTEELETEIPSPAE